MYRGSIPLRGAIRRSLHRPGLCNATVSAIAQIGIYDQVCRRASVPISAFLVNSMSDGRIVVGTRRIEVMRFYFVGQKS